MTQTPETFNLDGIAIIGMSGRFPCAKNIEQFWQNLVNGVEAISRFREEELEFSVATPVARTQGQKFVAARSVLDDVDLFDAAFFGIYPREAEVIDPQHRLFLECAWESLESAGYDPEAYRGLIGVYAGLSLNSYLLYNLCSDRALTADFAGNYQVGNYLTMLGNDKDFLPTRVSYKLNLRGPSLTVQTACSTSLVAVCQACTSLLNYQTDMALAGGVSITFPQKRDYLYEEDGMMSADGTIRAFDADARGTVFGHGVAVVLLKRLADAVTDGDNILAVIKGTAVNNDGSEKIGYAAPSVNAQAEVITMAQVAAGVDPEAISYVEAHGTGTPLGDPIEVAALTQAFRDGGAKRNGYCALSSGKTHIGHLDIAAGAAGLIKTVLQLQHEKIPPLLHFKSPNPQIDFVNSPFCPVTKLLDWKRGKTPRRAGVSSFGVGGTNAHVVVEEAPELGPTGASRTQQLLLLSAKTETALQRMTENLAAHLEENPTLSLPDAAFTLQKGREPFAHRRAVVVSDTNDAVAKLKSADARSMFTGKAPQTERPVVFLFPGQGAQYVDMGRELYEGEPTFRAAVDHCAEILCGHLGRDLRQVLYPDADGRAEAERQINETWITQPAIFVVEYALAKLWLSWGVKPSVVIGHSIGEFACAVLAETFTLDSALGLLAIRARLMQALPAGSMLTVRRGASEVKPLLPVGASIAAVNSPNLCTVSGPTGILQAFQKDLEARRVASKFLPTSHAFHSAMMEPMLPEFNAAAQKIPSQPPKLRWISTCSGRLVTADDVAAGSYWAEQIRHTVRFADALEAVIGDAQHVLLEVGPGQTLGQLTRQHPLKPADMTVLGTLHPTGEPGRDLPSILAALGKLWIAGVKPDWDGFYAHEKRRRVPLPTYPFERKRFWIEAAPVSGHSRQPERAQVAAPPVAAVEVTPAAAPITAESPINATSIPSSRKDRLAAKLRTLFQELSGSDQSQFDTAASFFDLGFDSLFLTQASQTIQSELGVKVTFRQMMKDLSTLESLSSYLDAKLPPDALPAPATVPAAAPAPAASVPSALAPLASPAASPSQASGPSPAGDSLVERVIQQQMAIMTQQLELLRQGGAASSISLPAPVAMTPAKPVITAVKHEKEDTQRFGPFKPIDKGPKGELTPRQQKAFDALVARYNRRTAKSKALAQQHRAHFCDPRAAGNFRQLWKEMVYPIVCVRSKGSRIWDLDGNEYLDVTMGFGTNYLGHSPDFVVRALEEQLKLGVEIGPQLPRAGEVAQMICEFTGMERMTFCNTGSEAVMAALRVARTVTGREKIVYFYGDYHGMFDEVLGRPAFVNGQPGAMPVAPGIPHLANVMVLEYGSPAALETIQSHAHEIAAVLVEPVQSRHPDLQPREFLHEVRRLTEQCEIALIFDEVITGFRVAPGGAQEYFGVRADLATYGKVIGGGMPIGVLAGKASFMDALDGGFWQYGDDSMPPTGVTFFAGTFVRHPLAIAASHAAMKFLKAAGPKLQQETNQRTARFVSAMNAHFEACELPMRLQGFSALFYYDFHPELKYAGLLFYYLRDRGVHIWEGRLGCLSIAHTDQDMDFLLNAFKESVAEMREGGFLPGKDDIAVGDSSRAAKGALPAAPKTPASDGNGKIQTGSAPVLLAPAAGATQGFVGSAAPRPAQDARPQRESSRFPLTEGQMEMWLAAQMAPHASGPHHASNVVQIEGDLDVEALRRAIEEGVNRHEALRATFSPDGTEIVVAPSVKVDVAFHDLSGLPPVERDERIRQVLNQEGRLILDLVKGPLFSFQLIKVSVREHLLVFTVQMIVCDGWGYTLVLEDISAIYSALIEGRPPTLGSLTPMREYARWQQRQLGSPEAGECEAFWLERFKTLPPPLDLPGFQPRKPARSFEGDRENLRLSKDFYQVIKRMAKELKCTPFAVLLAAFETWLYRLSGLDDLVVGVPFAGQSGAGLENLVGQCVHTLPLRMKLEAGETFARLAAETSEALFDAQENWNYSFAKLVQKLELPRDPSRIPLVSVMFNLDLPLSKVRFAGCTQHITATPRFYFQYDLGFNLVDEGDTLLIECDYNRNLFEANSIQHWLGHYRTLLEGAVANPSQTLDRLPLLSEAEQRQRIVEWNDTSREYSSDATIHSLVAAQAARTPDAVAIEWEGQKLTYAELESRANQLANLLRSLGVASETLVGVCVQRSPSMVVALLGVLKAGGAYVPLDPDHPRERIADVLEDTGAPVLLTHGMLLPGLPETKARIICLDEDRDVFANESVELVPAGASPANLAYVIYTSGSTGRPKGVEVTHGAVVNFLESMRREPGLSPSDVVLALTTLSFDIAVLEIFLPLILGARAVIVGREVLIDANELSRTITHRGVTLMQATPATWRMLLNAGWKGNRQLKVLCGGEALPPDLAGKLLDCCGEVWNMYGPTETTVWSTCCRIQRGEALTVGPPIANTQAFVVDDQLQPLPLGVPGELVIGGVGVARGYRGQQELTAEKFIPSPFDNDRGARLYRTGDLARYRPNGRIEFIGRRDFQVKLRGYRIELGEIESILLTHPRVREAVVVVCEENIGHPRLVAYLSTAEDSDAQGNGVGAASLRSELRQLLRGKLPDYMLPSAFVMLRSLPRTPEGKTCRLSLPPPPADCIEISDSFVAPRDATEQALARIWTAILKIETVGIRDNFFDMGGQSLLAVSLFAKVEQEFGRKLPLATLFRAPTIEQLAAALRSDPDASGQWASLVPIQPKGTKLPLFLVHGAGGNVLLYHCLAQHLAPDYPLYGLQSRGLDGKTAPLRTIEEMAVEYLRELREVQPEGPYCLGGYCLGGTVAYEMAQLLWREGEQVALLAMLDTYNFMRALKASFAGFLFEKTKFHLGNVARLGPRAMIRYAAEKVRVARDGELANLMTSRPGSSNEPGVARAESGIEASVQAVNDHAADHYVPEPYPGRLTLVKPHVNYKFYPDPNMGWGDLALGGLDIVELPVNPHAMLVEPYVRLLATELRNRLERLPSESLSAAKAAARPTEALVRGH